jgi:hypothetical protein
MSQKYKITSVSESADALEEQKVKDCKEFNRTVIKLVTSSCSYVVGGFFMNSAIQLDSYAPIAVIFSTVLIMVSGTIQYRSCTKLQNLYNKRGNEEVVDDETDLRGRKR